MRLPLAELRGADAETVGALDRSQQPGAREGTAVTTIDVVTADQVGTGELTELYDSVGWSAYTRDVGTLRRALAGSSTLVIARDGAVLIGLARVVSDGATICYLQDVLVDPSHQGHGVGHDMLWCRQRSNPMPTCVRRCCSPMMSPHNADSMNHSAIPMPPLLSAGHFGPLCGSTDHCRRTVLPFVSHAHKRWAAWLTYGSTVARRSDAQ